MPVIPCKPPVWIAIILLIPFVLEKEHVPPFGPHKSSGQMFGDMKQKYYFRNMEQLIQSWGEKAAGLRFMHQVSGGSWKNFSNKLTLSSIGITTLSAIASLVAASVQDEEAKNIVLYIVGGIGIVSSTLQSLKKFYI